MNAENTARLFSEYPLLYGGRDLPPDQNLMCFGFEVGDGWYKLIDELSAKIEAYNEALDDLDEVCMAVQVKEKYGTLRFYTSYGTEDIFKWIEEAEAKSEVTCELCGEPGVINETGWLTVHCPKCRKLADAESMQRYAKWALRSGGALTSPKEF